MLASWWGGASSLCDVLDILQRNMVSDGGNNTEKWPLEILFHVLTSDSPGSHIQNFTIGLSIGFGTTLAAFSSATLRSSLNGLQCCLRARSWRSAC